MRLLKSFTALKVNAYIWHRLYFKSFVFLDSSVQEVCNLDSLMVFVSLFNQLHGDLFSSCVPMNRFHATRQLNRFDLRSLFLP